MLSKLGNETVTPGKARSEYICLSTDTKPTDTANGSKLIEMDTGKTYYFDAENSTWIEFTTSQ